MKAIIYLDVPEWQIGQEVKVYFPDLMVKTGKCEKAKIVQKPERLLPCKCGCKRRSHWTIAGRQTKERYKLQCLKCGFEVYGSSEIDLHKKWNEAIKNETKFDPVQFLIEEHRRNTSIQRCPIKINMDPLKGPVDTEEQVAEKWTAIKQWYRDHPEAQAPWEEWEDKQKELAKMFSNDFLTCKE